MTAGILTMKGKKTVSQRVDEFGPTVRHRLAADFERVRVAYPPKKITFIGLKQEKLLEVWVASDSGQFVFLKSYPILGASGQAGPKLKEGDRQVPEGLYRIESLNPNSRFHLSLRVNYPNAFDKQMADADGRTNLGGDIMIHGSRSSIGCLAMGDPAAEELFILAAETGIDRIDVILVPFDLRTENSGTNLPEHPDWTVKLYNQIKSKLGEFHL
jgi:murein L,D-transpeptidase YafK